jgi:phosphatidylserine decarboxylase
VAPSDSKILNISEVKGDMNILVKNVKYKLGEFLTGVDLYRLEGELFESLKKNPEKQKSKIY